MFFTVCSSSSKALLKLYGKFEEPFVPDALCDLVSLGMSGSLFSTSLSDLDSSSDQGFLFFTFLEGVAPLGPGGFLTLGGPEAQGTGKRLLAVSTLTQDTDLTSSVMEFSFFLCTAWHQHGLRYVVYPASTVWVGKLQLMKNCLS